MRGHVTYIVGTKYLNQAVGLAPNKVWQNLKFLKFLLEIPLIKLCTRGSIRGHFIYNSRHQYINHLTKRLDWVDFFI